MKATTTGTARAPKARSRWWRVHAWLGLKLSLFMAIICLSGTLAVVANELDWLADPALRASPAAGQSASWGTLADNALNAVPGGRIDLMERGPDPWFATTVVIKAADGHRRRVLLDPATGKVNRVAGFGSIERFLRDFHRRLMLPVAIGIPLVTSLAFVLLTSLITGLVTYKKFWKGFFKRPRGGTLRKTSGDLHRLFGVWSLWFVALVVVTSLWYLVELLGASAPPTLPLQTVSKAERKIALPQPSGADLDRLAARAATAYPELTVSRVLFPFPGMKAVGFQGEAGTTLVTEKANAVFVDPVSNAVTLKVVGGQLSAHQRIAEMADPLHFGTFGGLATKLIWFVFGAGLTALSVTGVMIYATRLQPAQAGSRSAWSVAIRGVSWWSIPALALLIIALWLTPAILAG